MIGFLASYTSGAVAVSHDQVQCSTSLTPVAVHTAAAVMKNLLTQVSTLLGLLLKQQVAKLKKKLSYQSYIQYYMITERGYWGWFVQFSFFIKYL